MNSETREDLLERNRELQERLGEAEETLRAIQCGEVDAFVGSGPDGESVYTLKGADQAYRIMVEHMAQGAITVTFGGLILFSNEQFAHLLGIPLGRVIGAHLYDFMRPEDAALLAALLAGSSGMKAEVLLSRKDGTSVPAYISANRLVLDGTECVCLLVADLSEQKRNLEIVAAERLARSILEQTSGAILVLDLDGRIIRASRAAEQMASVPVLLRPFDEVFHLEGDTGGKHYGLRQILVLMQQGADVAGLEGTASIPGGRTLNVMIGASHLLGADSQRLGSIIVLLDISEVKRAEEAFRQLSAQLERALAEKIVLIKEVHHRVKNNLAVIAGLLQMQADSVEDVQARVALGESEQRVLSMALIHEHLYANENLDRVDFGKYVQQLTQELCAAYAIESDQVTVGVDAEAIEVPVHRAIPCGLILNELLSNALKYAYPRGNRGEIDIHFVRLESDELSLSCQDRGVGIPEDFDWHNSPSLGLRIVKVLTKQIDGTLTLDRNGGGTRFELRFPRSKPISQPMSPMIGLPVSAA